MRALRDSSDVPVFHISLDAYAELSRRRDMRPDEALDQALRHHPLNLQSTLSRVAASHVDIVLDLVLRDTPALDACIAALSPRRTSAVGVSYPWAILEQRERARPDRGEGMARSQIGSLPVHGRT
ncbi:phosphotransferase-like protein [Burkholderia arboris]|uniref:phosphotransferase-like protein n=1 Tax=Burkholderia arboris TaxID=488730 RepID=UPI0009C0C3B5|nr:chloramphenicol phosphotransferase CPT family protein [Burkholderia arboris]